MMSSLFFLWNILSLLNATTDINPSFNEHAATKKSSVEPDSPFTDHGSDTEASTSHGIVRSRSLSTQLPSFSTNSADTDQEDNEESERDGAKPPALKRYKSHSPKVTEEARRKSRRLEVRLPGDDLTHTYYGNVIQSSHYRSIRSVVFLAKTFCNLNAADIQRLLEELNISTFSSPFYVRKAENFFGYYTAAIYDVCEDKDLKYVVKFYNPSRTTFDKIRNLTEVKKIRALRKTSKMISLLPRLCFHEKLGDLSLADENYYFSIHRAARGELARDIFKSYASADAITKPVLRTKVLETIAAIGESIASFHCHHGLNNEFSQKSCVDYVLGIASSFNTIIHKDLHPGNIFIDLRPFAENKVTLIDLESMYVSCRVRQSNVDELNYLKTKIAEILDVDSDPDPDLLAILDASYRSGMQKTYEFYQTKQSSPV